MENFPKEKSCLQSKIEELNNTRDGLGLEIDEKIKEVVAILNLSGFNTIASCQGHLLGDNEELHGFGAPWILVENKDKPENRFKNEDIIYKKIAEKYGVSVEDVKKSNHENAWVEAESMISEEGETTEYKKWDREDSLLREELKLLAEEYNAKYNIKNNLRIKVEGSRIFCGKEDLKLLDEIYKNRNEKEEYAHKERLTLYRNELNNFARFVAQKNKITL